MDTQTPPDRPSPASAEQVAEWLRLAEAARRVVGVYPTTATASTVPGLGIVGPLHGEYAPLDLVPVGHAPTVEYLVAAAEAVPALAAALAAERERDVLKAELSAREHEVSFMRDSLRKVEHERELLDRYGRELDEIGRVMGCDHKDDGYMRCVTSQLADRDALRARLAEVEGERDEWEQCHARLSGQLEHAHVHNGQISAELAAAEADAGRLAEEVAAVIENHDAIRGEPCTCSGCYRRRAALAAHAGTESS